MAHTLTRGVRSRVRIGGSRPTPVLIASLALCLTPGAWSAQARGKAVSDDTAVYVTPNPRLYHRLECRRLSRPRAIALEEAAARYEPCDTCKPPRPGETREASAGPPSAPGASVNEPAGPALTLQPPGRPKPQAAAGPPITKDLEYEAPTTEPHGPSEASPPGSLEPQGAARLLHDPAVSGPVASFAELRDRILLYMGEKVYITTLSGEVKGNLRALTSDEIVLHTGKGLRTIGERQTLEIEVTRPDSIRDGFLVGMGTGVGLGMIAMVSGLRDDYTDTGEAVAGGLFASALFGGIFGGLFAGLDALHHERVLIYRSPHIRTEAPEIRVRPVATKRGAGVAIGVSF